MNDPFIEEEAAADERAPTNYYTALADEAAASTLWAKDHVLLKRLEQAVRELVAERDEGQDLLEGQCALNKLLVTQCDEARAQLSAAEGEAATLREQRDALILQRAETVQELLQLKQLVDELSR